MSHGISTMGNILSNLDISDASIMTSGTNSIFADFIICKMDNELEDIKLKYFYIINTGGDLNTISNIDKMILSISGYTLPEHTHAWLGDVNVVGFVSGSYYNGFLEWYLEHRLSNDFHKLSSNSINTLLTTMLDNRIESDYITYTMITSIEPSKFTDIKYIRDCLVLAKLIKS